MKKLWILAIICAMILAACEEDTLMGNESNNNLSTDGSVEAKDEFANMVEKSLKADGMVSYERSNGKLTQYLKGDRLRIDAIVEGSEVRTYALPGEHIQCIKIEDWSCVSIPSNESVRTADIDASTLQDENLKVTRDGTMEITDVSATCYKVTYNDTNPARYCYSPEGIPLFISLPNGDELKATEYSTSVLEDAFTVPAEPIKVESPEDLQNFYQSLEQQQLG